MDLTLARRILLYMRTSGYPLMQANAEARTQNDPQVGVLSNFFLRAQPFLPFLFLASDFSKTTMAYYL